MRQSPDYRGFTRAVLSREDKTNRFGLVKRVFKLIGVHTNTLAKILNRIQFRVYLRAEFFK